jgi:hypothetical protein
VIYPKIGIIGRKKAMKLALKLPKFGKIIRTNLFMDIEKYETAKIITGIIIFHGSRLVTDEKN